MNCPSCGAKLLQPGGSPRSKILLVGEAPGQMDLNVGMPFTGPLGDVLKQEFNRARLDFRALRTTYLWLHEKPSGKKLGEVAQACYSYCLGLLLEEMAKARATFLTGAELAQLFMGHSVTKINGLQMTSRLAPGCIEVVMAAYSPGVCLSDSGVVGDFRFAVERFALLVRPIYTEMLHDR